MTAPIIILTGERGVGKSTVCQKTVAQAQAQGYTCGGVITLTRSPNVRDVLDVWSGDMRQLTLDPNNNSLAVEQGHFRFDPATLMWAQDVLAHATPCDLFVVDELGPLEIERNEGWASAFDVLWAGRFALALVVIRPEMVEQARRKLPGDATTILSVTLYNRDAWPATLLKMFEASSDSVSDFLPPDRHNR